MKAIIYIHYGLGDNINMIGAVRYLSKDFEEFRVFCGNENYARNIQRMYEDSPHIKCIWDKNYNQNKPIPPHIRQRIEFGCEQRFVTGHFSKRNGSRQYDPKELPDCFYRDLDLDPEIQRTHFHIPKPLFSIDFPVPYIFVHQVASNSTLKIITWDVNEKLTIDPDNNLYPQDHVWYKIANICVNLDIVDYQDIISGADEVHVVDSCFFCLARFLPLQAKIKKCYNRFTGEISEI